MVFIFSSLPLIAPYVGLIMDIVYKADYKRLLLDACLSGPCLVLAVMMWAHVKKISDMYLKSDKENLSNDCLDIYASNDTAESTILADLPMPKKHE